MWKVRCISELGDISKGLVELEHGGVCLPALMWLGQLHMEGTELRSQCTQAEGTEGQTE